MNDPAPAAERSPPLLAVRDLEIEVATDQGRRPILHRVSFDLAAGETLCIAGESGSGKSMTALAVMRLLPEPMARIVGGRIALSGLDLTALDERTMRKVRGEEVAMIFQEPMTSLNPVLSIGRQLTEAIRAHRRSSRREARETALEALGAVHISDPARRLDQYPHELSGGMRQRVMIAMALALRPKVLIADEPTTALDVTVQAQILALIRDLQRDHGTAVLLITHDMGVVAEMADRVVMMHDGRIVEEGAVGDIFSRPKEDYSRALLAAVPRLGAMAGKPLPSLPAKAKGPVVEASNLTVRFEIGRGYFRRPTHRVHAVEGISFGIEAGGGIL